MTPPQTVLQLASECARDCLDAARSELPEEAWAPFIDFLTVLVASEARKQTHPRHAVGGRRMSLPRLTAAERERLDERALDPEGFENRQREAEDERAVDCRLWAALMIARDVRTCESICRGLPVRVGNLDRFVLRRALRGSHRLGRESYLLVTGEMLDAIAEAGIIERKQLTR